jgi:hypothetical protein
MIHFEKIEAYVQTLENKDKSTVRIQSRDNNAIAPKNCSSLYAPKIFKISY